MKKHSIFSVLLIFLLFGSFLNAQPSFTWAKQMGGTGGDGGASITTDGSGNVYTTGVFAGTVDFDPGAGTYNLTPAGGKAIFVSKLDVAGNFVWAKSIDGAGGSTSITLDASGNVYTTGYCVLTTDFDPGPGTYNLTPPCGAWAIFVSKLDASGNFVWAKLIDDVGCNGSPDMGYSIVVDGGGNVFTTGYFYRTADFDPGPGSYNLTAAGPVVGGATDIFISKLDASGNFVWAKRMGGTEYDMGHSIAVDASGNVYTSGCFVGTADFDPGSSVYNLTWAGGSNLADVFISKLDAAGNFVWAKSMGGTGLDDALSITVDGSMNVYSTGVFAGTADLDPGAGTYNLTSVGSSDIFVSKLDASGNFLWAKQMGGIMGDQGQSIVLDGNGNIFTTGRFFSSTADFDPGMGVYNLNSAGMGDIFVSKLDVSGNFVCAGGMGGIGNDAGASIAVDASGNIHTAGSFQSTADFDPGAGTYNLTSAGGWDIFASKLGGCLTTVPFVYANGSAICVGNCTTITANPSGGTSPYIYSWNPGGQTTQSITVCSSLTTTYTVLITDANSNTASDTAVVAVNTSGVIASISGATTICAGGNTTLTVSGGGTYSWNTGATTNSIIVTPTSMASYSVVVSAGGCVDTTSIVVNVNPLPTPSITGNKIICVGTSTTLTASGGNTYLWSPGGQTTSSIIISPSATTVYAVTATNLNGCSNTWNALVTVNTGPGPLASISGPTTLCAGSNATLIASGGGTYLWNTGASTSSIIISPTSLSTYSLIVSKDGCSDTTSIIVNVNSLPIPSITGNTTVCIGQNATLTASGGGTYSWNTGATSSFITTSSAGTYSVIVSMGSCFDTASATVTVSSNPGATTSSTNASCSGGKDGTATVAAAGGTPSYTYLWSPAGGTSSVATGLSAGGYTIIITDANGCIGTHTVTINTGINSVELYLPNAFSPNGDGENDALCLQGGIQDCIKELKIIIYDRWGEKIYESDDPKFCWEGKYLGKMMNCAVFVYYLEATLISGATIKKKGNISLVR